MKALAGHGGTAARAFLQYPEDASCSMEDELWSMATRQPVDFPRTEYNEHGYLQAATTCRNKKQTGATCGKELDRHGLHSTMCQSGGGLLLHHDHLARATAGLLKRWTNQQPLLEQRVPAWDRPRQRPRDGEDFSKERSWTSDTFTETNAVDRCLCPPPSCWHRRRPRQSCPQTWRSGAKS